MDYGLQSHIFYFHPRQSTNRLLIWHQGHDDTLESGGGYQTISLFLQQGYSVLAAWMPLLGPNRLETPLRIDDCLIGTEEGYHEDFACVESPAFTPIKYFVEPVAVALNYALRQQRFADVAMIGLSGGGWTTTLYAALDPRVRVSIPVAGTLPSYLRVGPYADDQGDWEQWGSALYDIANYLDLYILGSYGPGRKQLQVLNQYDDCCFAGVRYRTYVEHVRNAVARLKKGAFAVFLDDSARPDLEGEISPHAVSAAALAAALHALGRGHVQVVDNSENTYRCGANRGCYHDQGKWTSRKEGGFRSDARVAEPGAGEAVAVWQFNAKRGRYRIAVTWDPCLGPASTAAPFAVYDGGKLLALVRVDQQQTPGDFSDAGARWKVLGSYRVRTGWLGVRLTNQADGPVMADAVRIDRL